MLNREPSSLVIAIRVYPDTKKAELDFDKKKKRKGTWRLPDTMFVWDTETRTDQTQRLTFGSYRLVAAGQLIKENLFCGPTLPAADRRILEHYAATPKPIVSTESAHDLSLLTRHEFVEKLFRAAYKGRFLLTAFNFPFDASRVARDLRMQEAGSPAAFRSTFGRISMMEPTRVIGSDPAFVSSTSTANVR